MADEKNTGFALIPKGAEAAPAKKEETSKIFGIETRTLIALGALGVGAYLVMTHDSLEEEDGLKPERDAMEPEWWREARENEKSSGGGRDGQVRGARRVGHGYSSGDELDRAIEEEAESVEQDEIAAMEDDDEEESFEIDEEDE